MRRDLRIKSLRLSSAKTSCEVAGRPTACELPAGGMYLDVDEITRQGRLAFQRDEPLSSNPYATAQHASVTAKLADVAWTAGWVSEQAHRVRRDARELIEQAARLGLGKRQCHCLRTGTRVVQEVTRRVENAAWTSKRNTE
jgi:hypothetical protein